MNNRLQKKCIIASFGFHVSLALIILIGPAFLAPKPTSVDLPPLDFVPAKLVDAAVSGGGNPRGQLPPPPTPVTPPQPTPQPAAIPPERQPKVEHDTVQPVKPDEPSLEVRERKHEIKVNLTPVKRRDNTREDAKARADAQAQEIADARRRAATMIGQTVTGIQNGVSGTTVIEMKGPGGGGLPYANWLQAVKQVYTDAWVLTNGAIDDSATATASITIARDGTVISAEIIRFSGNASVDQSVKMALDRVTHAPPLPDEATESKRTVTINFNARVKLLG